MEKSGQQGQSKRSRVLPLVTAYKRIALKNKRFVPAYSHRYTIDQFHNKVRAQRIADAKPKCNAMTQFAQDSSGTVTATEFEAASFWKRNHQEKNAAR